MQLNEKNKLIAKDYVAYLLSKDLGLTVINKHGQQTFTSFKIQEYEYESLPQQIKAKIGQ